MSLTSSLSLRKRLPQYEKSSNDDYNLQRVSLSVSLLSVKLVSLSELFLDFCTVVKIPFFGFCFEIASSRVQSSRTEFSAVPCCTLHYHSQSLHRQMLQKFFNDGIN